ncbi:MAG: DsrE family protein [Pseudomonadota bacterium]
MRFSRVVTTMGMVLASSLAAAQYPAGAKMGPIIEEYGPVMAAPPDAFAMDNERSYKIVKDVVSAAGKPGEMNRHIEAVARLLNMQAQAGMPAENMDVAVVVHGPAIRDLLSDEAYRERFGMANPNTGLLSALEEAGVKVYLCSQTAAGRGYSLDSISPSATVALSAMGAHIRLQDEGYTLIPF